MASGDALPSWRVTASVGTSTVVLIRKPSPSKSFIFTADWISPVAAGGASSAFASGGGGHIGFAFVLGLVGVVPFLLGFGGIIFVVILRLGGLWRILIGGGVATAGRVRHRKATAQTAPKVSKPLKNCPITPPR